MFYGGLMSHTASQTYVLHLFHLNRSESLLSCRLLCLFLGGLLLPSKYFPKHLHSHSVACILTLNHLVHWLLQPILFAVLLEPGFWVLGGRCGGCWWGRGSTGSLPLLGLRLWWTATVCSPWQLWLWCAPGNTPHFYLCSEHNVWGF